MFGLLIGLALAQSPQVAAGEDARIRSLLEQGRPEQALLAARQLVQVRSLSLGPDHPDLVPLYHLLGRAAEAAGELDVARNAISRAVDVELAGTGVSVELAADLGMLGSLEYALGDYSAAQGSLEHAVEVAQQAAGDTNPYAVLLRRELARVQRAAGDLDAATASLTRVITDVIALDGADSVQLVEPLWALGRVEREAGRLEASRARLEQALGLTARGLGTDDVALPLVLEELSTTLFAMGQGDVARAGWKMGLEAHQLADTASPGVEGTLRRGFGATLLRLGELDAARSQLERARALHEAAFGPRHPEVAADLLVLGRLQHIQGDPLGARRSLERALTLRADGSLVERGEVLRALCDALAAAGDRAGAQSRLASTRLAWEAETSELHPAVLELLEAEAVLLVDAGQLAQARERFAELLERRELTGGPYDAGVAEALTELGRVFLATGEQPRARKVLERAWRVAPRGARRGHLLARARAADGNLDTALEVVAEVLEVADGETALALRGDQARWMARLGDPGAEVAAAKVVVEARKSGWLDRAQGWQALLDAADAGQATAIDALPGVIRTDAVAHRLLGLADESERLEAVGLARHALDRWVLAHWEDQPVEARWAQVLWTRGLARQALAGRRVLPQPVSPVLACEGLRADEAWLHYAVLGGETVVFAARGEQCGSLTATRLANVQPPLDALRRLGPDWDRWTEREQQVGASLREAVWDPVAAQVGDSVVVYLSADPALSDLPMAGLPIDDDVYLVERHAFAWLPDPAELLLPPVQTRRKGKALVVGAVDTRKAVPQAPDRPHQAAPCAQGVASPPRPAANAAVKVLQRRLGRSRVAGLGGVAAGEAVVEARVPGMRVLHLSAMDPGADGRCVDRLQRVAEVGRELALGWHGWWRNGLQLAGAATPQDALSPQPDGVWTPAEVARIDASEADWVLLTAMAPVDGGPSLWATRSAWHLAGARFLVMRQWDVPADAQGALLQQFYKRALRARSDRPALVLAQAQRWILDAQRREDRNGRPGLWASWSVGGRR